MNTWDDYNISWLGTTESKIDYINSFIEVYNDPLGHKGSDEEIVVIKNFDMSKKMEFVSSKAKWFENISLLMPKHKKKEECGRCFL